MDPNGNLVLNGQPFLLIQATNMDYMSWFAGGYTGAQADGKLTQMAQWGYNTLFGDWTQFSPGTIPNQTTWMYQDQVAWQLHGLYWHGSATLDDTFTQDGNMLLYGTAPGQSVMGQIVSRYRTHPGLLLWWIADEINYDQQAAIDYCNGAAALGIDNPARVWGDTMVDTSVSNYETMLGAKCLPVVFVEEVMQYGSPPEAIAHAYDGLTRLNQAWSDGYRFVLGFSTTPLGEIDFWPNGIRQMSAAEIHRYFMLQVAMNVRAFDVLWGANQRDPSVPVGDNLPPAYLSTWNSIGQEIATVKSLQSIILAPGKWQQLTTTPAFQAYVDAGGGSYNDFTGVYAAEKTVGGVTYIIACNMSWISSTTGPWADQPVNSATISVGVPIRSVTRMFETGAVTFTGSVITDSFPPMGVHIYVVQ